MASTSGASPSSTSSSVSSTSSILAPTPSKPKPTASPSTPPSTSTPTTTSSSSPRYEPPPPIDPTRHTFKTPKLRSGHSIVWDIFRIVDGDTDDTYKDWAYCTECKLWWRRPGGSTYGLLKHVNMKHRPKGEDGQPTARVKHRKGEETAEPPPSILPPSTFSPFPSAPQLPPLPSLPNPSSSSSSSSSSLLAAGRSLASPPPSTPFTPLSLEVLRVSQHNFASDRAWHAYHTPRNLVLALTGEVGELAEIFQWKGEVPPGLTGWSAADREHVGEEMSDVLMYLIRLADVCGVDLGAAVEAKMKRNAEKYPVERVRGKSEKYSEYEEYQEGKNNGSQHRITAQIEKDRASIGGAAAAGSASHRA